MCLTTTSVSAQGAGLKLERAIAPALPAVMADRGVLIQMLLNLLGNAIKFTEPGGTIRVEAKINAAGGLDLAVHDDGIGIAQDDIPLVLRSEEHTSELQSLMRISYAVFCLKQKKGKKHTETIHSHAI